MKFVNLFLKVCLVYLVSVSFVKNLKTQSLRTGLDSIGEIQIIDSFNFFQKSETADVKETGETKFNYFKYIGNKTFICLCLLYFQNNATILMISSILSQFLVCYFEVIFNFQLTDVIPIDLFRIGTIITYFLSGFAILLILMFPRNQDHKKIENKNLDAGIKFGMKEFKMVIRIVGVVLLSRVIDGTHPCHADKLITLALETYAIILSVICAALISFFASVILSLNCNLMICAINYLLLAMTVMLNYFSIHSKDSEIK